MQRGRPNKDFKYNDVKKKQQHTSRNTSQKTKSQDSTEVPEAEHRDLESNIKKTIFQRMTLKTRLKYIHIKEYDGQLGIPRAVN